MSKRLEMIRASKRFVVVDDLTDASSIHIEDFLQDNGEFVRSTRGKHCTYSVDFCWPIEAHEELVRVITERQRLQKIADDSMKLVYDLNNRIARGELK